MRNLAAVVSTFALAACGGGLEDEKFSTGSSSIIASSDYQALYVANTDAGTVSRLHWDTKALSAIEVGAEPTRLCRVGNQVLVTLRGERAIAVLDDVGGTLVLNRKIATAAEPFGIVADEQGKRVYVAMSTAGEVWELNSKLDVRRTWQVPGQPRWLALHPSRKALYVASAYEARLSWIELGADTVHPLELPEVTGFNEVSGVEQPLAPRLTGDPAVTPDGEVLLVPGFYVDNFTPVPTPAELQAGVAAESPTAPPCDCFDCGCGGPGGGGGYDSGGSGARLNPVVVAVPVNDDGVPKIDNADTIRVSSIDANFGMVNSYPSSVTASPDSRLFLVTMEGSAAVVAVARDNQDGFSAFDVLLGGGGGPAFAFRPNIAVTSPAGARGVAFLKSDVAFVYGFLDRTVARIHTDTAKKTLEGRGDRFDGFTALNADTTTQVSSNTLPGDEELGRRLFYSANDPRMASLGAGISCATCHFDGRNDGLTWTFTNGVRQTPSLAGKVSLTAPVTWTDFVPSVSDEVTITSQLRMGGAGLSAGEASLVATFIDSIRPADLPSKGSQDPAVLRGKAVFERADVKCSTCHSGPMLTDNLAKDMFGLPAVKTRSLIGIAATAPYFHDGSAATLREVLRRARSGEMGDTSMLSGQEMTDLEAYLNSL